MKKLIFEELLLMSALHKRARKITFHPHITVISGDNETGKSAIIKSLYGAFGAVAPVVDQAWKNAEVITLLRFSIDGQRFTILREMESCTVFNAQGKLIGTYGSHVREGLAAKLAEMFDFKLHFYTSSGEGKAAHPAYLFAPFYVDQFKGWAGPWSSFSVLKASRRVDAVEYHVGIRPNAYFEAKAQLQALHEELVLPEQELNTLSRILADIRFRTQNSALNVDTQTFAKEVERLVLDCQQLSEKEESYRDELMRLENERLSLLTQAGLMQRAAQELKRDYQFAFSKGGEIECPTCGARYENSIVDKFLIAQDEDRCVNFIAQLDQEVSKIDQKISEVRSKFSETTAEVGRINEALDSRSQQLSLREVIQAEGQREFRAKVVADMAELQTSISELRGQVHDVKKAMRDATDKKRKREIKDQYARLLQGLAINLGVSPVPAEMMRRVAPKIPATGSDLPRRLLAYYIALLHTIHQNTSGLFAPFVVDAVNQQDQEDGNLVKMLGVLFSGLPKDTQLILSCVDTKDIEFDGIQIKLLEKRGVLRDDEYQPVVEIVRPFIEAKLQAGMQKS